MAGKAKKGSKPRRTSAISKATRRKKPSKKSYAPTPITDAARIFLYECPGGMDTNEKRDKFMECASRVERTGGAQLNVVENVVRSALFQGQAHGRGNPTMRKPRGKKRGPLDMGDQHVLRVLAEHIGKQIFERLGGPNDDEDFHSNILAPNIRELSDSFDCTGDEHDLWDMELYQLASDILDRVLERTKERLEVLMGASVWKTMGLPQF